MKKVYLLFLMVIFLVFFVSFITGQQICSNSVGSHGQYTYEYWKDSGSGCMELGPNGTFNIDWSNINNLLARTGVRPGTWNHNVQYDVDYRPNGHSYMCVYGWTQNPLIEYYIVDDWKNYRPPNVRDLWVRYILMAELMIFIKPRG